jgi:hypoxanthine-DNA glycosylase
MARMIHSAFWWIVGDCLGFRRASGISPSTNQPYKFSSSLRPHSTILPYPEQVSCLLRHGFGLWDIIAFCERPGSLDQDITQETPNDLRGLTAAHPSLRRLVLTNGTTAGSIFRKHFKEWLKSGELQAAEDAISQKVLGKACRSVPGVTPRITIVVAKSVSPAAAIFSYSEKRDFWEEHVFQPGLEDHKRL